MKRGFVLWVAVGLAVIIGFGRIARAELTPEQTKEAEGLIGQFTSPEFAVRQKAVEELIKVGPGVLPLVQRALAETKDKEAKLRCGIEPQRQSRPSKFRQAQRMAGWDRILAQQNG